MAIGSGLGASIGVGSESTYGTGVTPTRWTEFDSETMEFKPKRVQGNGLAGGVMVNRQSQRVQTTAYGAGDIKTALFTKGMGLWLGGIFGSLTTTPVQQGGTSAYKQTHALANNYGQSLTIQKGVPDVGGTVHPYTFLGCKIEKAVFECGVDEIAMLTMTVDAKDMTTATSLTTPVYQTSNPPFHFAEGVVTKGAFGSEAAVSGVRKATVTIERPMWKDPYYLDGTGRKKEPPMNHFVKITGDVELDLLNVSDWDTTFINDSSFSLILTFTGSAIGGGNNYAFTLNVSDVHLDSENPKVGGPDVVKPKMSFVGLYDDANTACTATYTTTDTTL